VILGILRGIFGKPAARERSRWDTVFCFQFSAMRGDTRRAAISATYAEDDGIRFFLNFLPHLGLIHKHDSLFVLQDSLHAGKIAVEPGSGFLKEFPSSAESYIHEVNSLALDGIETGRQWLRFDGCGRLTARIQDGA
jgi:hypothetical protein